MAARLESGSALGKLRNMGLCGMPKRQRASADVPEQVHAIRSLCRLLTVTQSMSILIVFV